MTNILFIFIGAGLGGVIRHLCVEVVSSIFNTKFSLGVLVVNCIGSLLIGFLINFFDTFLLNYKWRLFLITGFLGGYTTFSTYSLNTVAFFSSGEIKLAFSNIFLSNILCILLVFIGLWINKLIFVK